MSATHLPFPAAARSRNLDALRAVGALGVVGMHANALVVVLHPGAVDSLTLLRFSMWSGVNLFFALSGYLITLPFVRALLSGAPLPDSRAYLLRRAARILPAYWLALVALDLVTRVATGGAVAASHVLLLQDLVPGQARTVFPIAWSLGIEAMFYLAVPAAAVLVRRRHRGPVLPGALVAAVGAAWVGSALLAAVAYATLHKVSGDWQDMAMVSLPAMLCFFCPGIALAALESAAEKPAAYLWLTRRAPVLAVTAVAGWAALCLVADLRTLAGQVVMNQGLAVLSGLAVVAALHAGPRLSRAAALLAPVGEVSYGIYLWHWVLAVAWATQLGPVRVGSGSGHLAWLGVAVALAAGATALGALSWFLVERPAMRRAAAAGPRHATIAESHPQAAPSPALP